MAQMTKAEIDAAFAGWWEKYWRKVGKQDARKAYGHLLTTGHTPQFLLEKLQQYYARWRPTQDWERWVCLLHPTTWLNGRRWEDEVPVKVNGRISPAWHPKLETCGQCLGGWIEGTLGNERYCDCPLGDTLKRQIEMREA